MLQQWYLPVAREAVLWRMPGQPLCPLQGKQCLAHARSTSHRACVGVCVDVCVLNAERTPAATVEHPLFDHQTKSTLATAQAFTSRTRFVCWLCLAANTTPLSRTLGLGTLRCSASEPWTQHGTAAILAGTMNCQKTKSRQHQLLQRPS